MKGINYLMLKLNSNQDRSSREIQYFNRTEQNRGPQNASTQHKYVQMIFRKGSKQFHVGRITFSTNGLEQLNLHR